MRRAAASLAALGGAFLFLFHWPAADASNPSNTAAVPASAGYDALDGWADDDHAAAFVAFRRSCDRIVSVAEARSAQGKEVGDEIRTLLKTCRAALALAEPVAGGRARSFFEENFTPRLIDDNGGRAFLTGYFEPELEGDRVRSERFHVPILRKPFDLVMLTPDLHRAANNHKLTAGRPTSEGYVPYETREEIEKGALSGQGLELLYLADRFDAFVLHVQGSGRVVLPDGSVVRLAYAAKNGHPYTSIGRILIERGEIAKEDMSLATLEAWVRQNPKAAKELMWQNRSYIFFRELAASESRAGPLGAQGVSLTPGRSLAVDASIHHLGTPIWVDAPELAEPGGERFRRLMVAQDVGSAIKGAGRGDIYWGSGAAAREIAGVTRHAGRFWTLVPRSMDSTR